MVMFFHKRMYLLEVYLVLNAWKKLRYLQRLTHVQYQKFCPTKDDAEVRLSVVCFPHAGSSHRYFSPENDRLLFLVNYDKPVALALDGSSHHDCKIMRSNVHYLDVDGTIQVNVVNLDATISGIINRWLDHKELGHTPVTTLKHYITLI
jgi:hypothetical protein